MAEKIIKTGTSFKIVNDRRLYHVCGFTDNGLAIVWKYYGIYKQWWHYEVEETETFNSRIECGLYKIARY